MHIIVLGAQPVGEYLMRLALDAGHSVSVIEADSERAEYCVQNYDAEVLHARIDEEGIMDEAGAKDAQAFIATTTDDSVNLMAMVMGREYEIPKLVSVVNSKFRKSLFDHLGVATLVDPEILAARYLWHLTVYPGNQNVTPLAGEGQIYELELGQDSKLTGMSLGDIHGEKLLPKGVFVIFIKRAGKHLFPRTETALEADDKLLVYSVNPLAQADLDIFTGNAS